ncbi:hypothetical protein F9288_09060 [Sphingomonas sp. CL5.1]|uniref:FecR domain-containing protein n=1 Tax=Sphingomonas sp. CL5.1 TaxID=2653203 RepID=UPI0015815329|nr:FecR domain-containing protein [Sphingomonas sp. CL5.1]QKR99768.1 hypothetical protein F9288_09060 [Sphingomonas sp. CL5.1]
MRRIEPLLAAALAMFWCLAARPAAAEPITANAAGDSLVYQLKPGQNLYGLAARYLMRREDFRVVQRVNRIADALRIPTGTTLRIPVRLLRSEPLVAHVLAARGSTRMISGGTSVAARAGAEIQPGTTIETGTDGFVSIGLSNASQLSIPTRSRIRLDAMRRIILTNAVRFEITVDSGKLETQATPLAPNGSDFRLHTPRALTAIRGTVLRVGYDDATGGSVTEVLDGTVAVAAGPADNPAMVHKGFGASISPSGAVATEALLPAPDLDDPGAPLIDPVATFRVKPVAGARSYHVQVASDAGFNDLVAEASGDDPAIHVPGLADGRWFARISAIATSGLEGASQVYSVRRALTGVNASAGRDQDRLLFKWAPSGQGRHVYRFQLVEGTTTSPPVIDEPGLTGTELSFTGLPDGVYFWRVQVRQYVDGDRTETWSPFQKLTVASDKR